MKRLGRVALVAISLGVIAAVGAACSKSKSGGGTPGAPVVTHGDGSAVDLTCNHTLYDPASTNTNITSHTHLIVQSTSTSNAASASVVVWDAVTGTTSGTVSTADGSGNTDIATKDSTRTAFKEYGGLGNLVSYDYNHQTGAVGATSGVLTLRIASNVVYQAAVGTIFGTNIPPEVAGHTQLAGSIVDCTGSNVMNATITVGAAELCSAGAGFPCIGYTGPGSILPSPSATMTAANGQFFVFGIGTNDALTVTVNGVLTAGAAAVPIGELTIHGASAEGGLSSIAFGAAKPFLTP